MRHISFVDNARVSYSNPVRQSLFRFRDSLNGGKSKSLTAAESLLEIVPSAKVTGYELTVPMPGHLVSEKGMCSTVTVAVQYLTVVLLFVITSRCSPVKLQINP